MDFKTFFFDVGLPSLAVITTGLVTFALTGGPEEYEESVENVGSFCLLNAIHLFTLSFVGYSDYFVRGIVFHSC